MLRVSDGSFHESFVAVKCYSRQVKMLDMFPAESGEDGKTERIIPFFPGHST